MNLKTYDDEFLDCREFLHAYVNRTLVELPNAPRGVVGLRVECARCGRTYTKKVKNGEIVGRAGTYPDGYLLKGEGRMNTIERRKEVIRRIRAGNGTVTNINKRRARAS